MNSLGGPGKDTTPPLPVLPRKPVTLAPHSRLRRPPALFGRQANCSNHFRKSAAHVYDTGGAFGLISYKRLHQTGRASGTLLPLLNEVADREAGTGFPDVFHIKNILALFSGNFTHGDPLVLHTVALNQFDLVLCAVSQHRVCFDISRQNAFYDREIFPLHTIAPF